MSGEIEGQKQLVDPEIDWTTYASIVMKNGKAVFGITSWAAIEKVMSGERKLTPEELAKDKEQYGYGCRVCFKKTSNWIDRFEDFCQAELNGKLVLQPTDPIEYLVYQEDYERLRNDPIIKDTRIRKCPICGAPDYFFVIEHQNLTSEKFFNKLAKNNAVKTA